MFWKHYGKNPKKWLSPYYRVSLRAKELSSPKLLKTTPSWWERWLRSLEGVLETLWRKPEKMIKSLLRGSSRNKRAKLTRTPWNYFKSVGKITEELRRSSGDIMEETRRNNRPYYVVALRTKELSSLEHLESTSCWWERLLRSLEEVLDIMEETRKND